MSAPPPLEEGAIEYMVQRRVKKPPSTVAACGGGTIASSSSAAPPLPTAGLAVSSSRSSSSEVPATTSRPEETMLDAMMREANAEKVAKERVAKAKVKKASKSFGASMSKGLKKGFLSGGKSKTKKAAASGASRSSSSSSSSSTSSKGADPEIVELKASSQPGENLVLDDVQSALRSAGLGDAKSDASKTLMGKLLANAKVRAGMKKPRLQKAMAQMGAAPQQAALIMQRAVARCVFIYRYILNEFY